MTNPRSCNILTENRSRQRIESISREKEADYTGWEFDGGHVEVNREDNRLQVFFDEKPDADIRAVLKSNGFRWAPSVGAWQRQLNERSISVAKDILNIG